MLLLMRRAGEAVRIKEDITLEVKQIFEDKVTFSLEGVQEGQVQLKEKASALIDET